MNWKGTRVRYDQYGGQASVIWHFRAGASRIARSSEKLREKELVLLEHYLKTWQTRPSARPYDALGQQGSVWSPFSLHFSLFYLAFTDREQVVTPGQHVSDTCNEGCPHAGDSDEISYLVVHGALQKGEFALFSSTVCEEYSVPAWLIISSEKIVSWSVVCAACCHMALLFAVMHLYKSVLLLFIPFFILFFFFNLVLINPRNGRRYQRVLSLCTFLTGVIPKGLILRQFCLMFVYVLLYGNLCQDWFCWFGITYYDVILCCWLGSRYQLNN